MWVEDKNSDYLYMDSAVSGEFETPVGEIKSGLEHLEGAEVGVMVDGGYQGTTVVQNGGIKLSVPGRHIKVGLLYDSVLRTLDLDYPIDKITVTAQGKRKKISSVNVFVDKSGIFEVAARADDTSTDSKLNYTKYGEGPDLISDYVKVDLMSGFNKNGEVFIRSNTPYPLTINAILPEVVHGG